MLTPVPVPTLRLSFIESLHSTAIVPGRIPQFVRCGRLVALKFQEWLQVGEGFEIAEYALQDPVPVDRFVVALFEPEQQLGFGIVQVVPPPVLLLCEPTD